MVTFALPVPRQLVAEATDSHWRWSFSGTALGYYFMGPLVHGHPSHSGPLVPCYFIPFADRTRPIIEPLLQWPWNEETPHSLSL